MKKDRRNPAAHDENEAQRLLARVLELETEVAALRRRHFSAQAELAAALESIGGGFVALDENWLFAYVNSSAERMLGKTRQELLGRDVWTEFPEVLGTPGEDALRRAAGGDPQELEIRYRRMQRWLRCRFSPRLDGGVVAYLEDVSERKRLEDLSRERLSEIEDIYRSAPVGLCVLDRELRFMRINDRLAEMNGIPAADHIGKSLRQLMPALADAAEAELRQVIETGVPRLDIDLEGETPAQPGVRRSWREQWLPIRNAGGSVVGVNIVAEETTERKRAELALAMSRDRFRTLIENLPLAVALVDRAGGFEIVNRPFLTLFKLAGAASIPPVHDPSWREWKLYDEHERPLDLGDQPFAALAAATGPVGDRLIGIRSPGDGEWTWVSVTAQRVHGADGRIEATICAYDDVTQRRRAEQQLEAARLEAERANNAKSRFLAAASHDLRQPLGALALYVGVLQRSVDDRDKPLVENVRGCVSSLSELLTNLLDISKLDAGVVVPSKVKFSLDQMLSGLLSVHLPEATNKGLRLSVAAVDVTGFSDPVLFSRMLGNLLSNAVRYTDAGGIVVGCRRRAGRTWVEVWDSGSGFPEEKSAEIFEEFKQLGDGARTRGSGLGLAIVARTAKLLDLGLRVRSRPGRGSMFALELPLADDADARRANADAPPSAASLFIGLVEDNDVVRDALEHALHSLGHRVVAAAGGSALLEALHGDAPDIVLSDYRLPAGETGFEVIARIHRRHGAHIPALIMTGETSADFMRSAARRGMAVVHKPVDVDVLQARLMALSSLAPFARELLAASDIRAVAAIASKAARRMTGAEGACFILKEGGLCSYLEEDAIGPLWKGQKFPLDNCISGWVMQHRRPAVIQDIYLDSRIPLEAYRPTFVRSVLAVPIGDAGAVGALTSYWASRHRASDAEVDALAAIARVVAEAVAALR